MPRLSKIETAGLAGSVFEILLRHPNGLREKALMKELENSLPGDGSANGTRPANISGPVLEDAAYVATSGPIKAGWLARQDGVWTVTENGARAYARYRDPRDLLIKAGTVSPKAWLSVHFPGLYSLAFKTRYQIAVEYNLARRKGLRELLRASSNEKSNDTDWRQALPVQRPRRIRLPEPSEGSAANLTEYLTSLGVEYSECDQMVYITPSNVEGFLGELLGDYPGNSALLICKQTSEDDKDSRHQLLFANLLFVNGAGPRVYDAIELHLGGVIRTAYVLDHMERHSQSFAAESLSELKRKGFIEESRRHNTENGHKVSEERADYCALHDFCIADYQSFLAEVASRAAEASHWGDKSLLRGWRYLYQSVPGLQMAGRRSTNTRVVAIKRLLESAGASIEGRLVLDVGCNIGMMMAQYLKLGARWCHGWDQAHITPHSEKLLLALGCTSFSISGGDLDSSKPIERDVPDFVISALEGCVISYLAVRGPLGWLNSLGTIPWSYLIYEGHEDETEEDFKRHMEQLRRITEFRIAATDVYSDGDCDDRRLAVLVRSW
jgi:hypothetical protein